MERAATCSPVPFPLNNLEFFATIEPAEYPLAGLDVVGEIIEVSVTDPALAAIVSFGDTDSQDSFTATLEQSPDGLGSWTTVAILFDGPAVPAAGTTLVVAFVPIDPFIRATATGDAGDVNLSILIQHSPS